MIYDISFGNYNSQDYSFIEIIKGFRMLTGMGLKEAKLAAESVRDNNMVFRAVSRCTAREAEEAIGRIRRNGFNVNMVEDIESRHKDFQIVTSPKIQFKGNSCELAEIDYISKNMDDYFPSFSREEIAVIKAIFDLGLSQIIG